MSLADLSSACDGRAAIAPGCETSNHRIIINGQDLGSFDIPRGPTENRWQTYIHRIEAARGSEMALAELMRLRGAVIRRHSVSTADLPVAGSAACGSELGRASTGSLARAASHGVRGVVATGLEPAAACDHNPKGGGDAERLSRMAGKIWCR